MGRSVVGVDVGGTFTDLILLDPESGAFRLAKTPTTAANQADGFLNGLHALDAPPAGIETLVHGTTIGTNSILERKGARCGLITTRGFRDVLELGRRTRPQPYGMTGSFEALIPRELRLEVDERIDAEGNVLRPLDEAEARAAIRRLLALGAEALVIHFLHSYANPEHERRCEALARQLWPNGYVTAGSRVLPEFREFERGTAAALNASIQPVIARYLGDLGRRLSGDGFDRELLIMQGNGGMMTAPVAAEQPIQTVMSGPAAGVIAAARLADEAGFPHAISCDMGGTSFDVALIRDGEPAVTTGRDLAYGVPIRIPMIDIHTIGSGGGSIARVNAAGLLQVGPQSAGAVPGPIGFGRGGEAPTVTDANLLLGRLNPDAMTGSSRPADLARIARLMEERVGRRLGLDAEATAAAILAVANNQMAGAIHLVSVGRGEDPRDFALVAFGGAGPLHATALARELGVPRVLVPRFPGLTSALGCILADVRHDFVRTLNRPLLGLSPAEVEPALRDQARRGRELLAREGVRVDRVEVIHEADLLYQGQTHMLRVPIDTAFEARAGEAAEFDAARLLARFAERYRERFDIELPEMRAVLVSLRTTVLGRRERPDLRRFAPVLAAGRPEPVAARNAYFEGRWLTTPVYRRDDLPVGASIAGPAIVEQLDATTVVDPGRLACVDPFGNLLISAHGDEG